MKKYTSYKENKISWIGEIPSHWKITSIKNCFNFKVGFTPPTGNDDYYDDDNGFEWVTISDLNTKYIDSSKHKISRKAIEQYSKDIVPKGSLLYSFKLSVGKVAFAAKDIFTNEAIFCVLPDDNLELNYYYYCLPAILIHNANENIYGAKIFNQEVIKNSKLPIPPLEEQTQIARYLDHQTSIIDQLIQKKERLIELLKEKRQSIINEAVTKGLNPKAKMKDSGIEWLGEVPEHWEILKLTWITEFITCGIASTPEYVSEEVGVPFLSAQNVKPDRIVLDKFKFISKELHAQLTKIRKPQKGDLLVTRVGAGIGEAAIVDVDFEFSVYVSLTHIRTNSKCMNKFLMYFFSTDYAKKLASDGTIEGGGQGNLNVKNVEAYRIGVPPIEEQKEILEFIVRNSNSLNELIAKNEIVLNKLKEYRQSIISEAVTGKIDVRDWQPNKVKVA